MENTIENKDVFEFNAEKHYYTLNGKRLYGVTTVLGVINKPALIQWAANLATARAFQLKADKELVKYIESKEIIDSTTAKEIGEKFPEFNQARLAHRERADAGAEAGTDTHATIEEIVDTCIADFEGFMYLENHEDVQVNNFVQWARENNVQFLFSELKLYSRNIWVAGTCDLVFKIGDKTFVGDVKTTNAIWDRTPFMQTAAYELMLKETYPDITVNGRCIIRLGKDGSFEVMYSYSDLDKEGFLSALSLFKVLEVPISEKQKHIKKAKYKKKK